MSGETQVGNIVYQVEMEVGKLITSQQQVNSRLDQMEDKFNSNAKSASNLESGMTKLASAIKLVMAAAALRGLADMVQRYQEMSERVQMATTSQSEFEHVQQRLLKTANGTYRSLSEAQELYITTAASLRSMNYTTDQAIDVQDSMSYAFVKNATSADRANGAISAFSKSMNKGKVEADSWETIIAAIPSVIDDIATASGKTSAQIRSLGSSGKITANQLSEGLRQSLDANSEAAVGMSNNLTDAGVRMKTAITSILVAMEGQTGALQTFTNGIISAADAILGFSQDTEKMPKALGALSVAAGIVAAVMASRYVGAMYVATAENIKHAASAYRVAAAQGAMATAARAGSLALSLVGGPAGAAMLAATAIFYFYQKSQQAKQEAIAFADGVDKLNNSMKSMSNTALKGTISDANVAIRGQVEAVAELESEIKNLIASRDDYVNRGKQFGTTAEQGNGLLQKAAEITDTLNQKQRDLSGLQSKLVATIKVRDDAQITLNNNMLTSMGVHDNLIEKGSVLERVQGAVAKAFGNTADEINRANQAGNNFNPQSLQVSAPTADGDKYIQSLEDQNKLLAIKDERLRAVTQAEMDQSKVTDNPNQIKRAGELAGTLYDQKKAQEGVKKETAAATKEETVAATEAKNRAKQLSDLGNSIEVTTLEMQGQSRAAAQLAAVQKLGINATPKEIALAREQAGAIYDLTVQIENMHKAKQGQQFAQQEITSALSPMAQIDIEEQAKLAKLAEYQALDTQNTQIYEDAKTAIQLQASQKRQEILDRESAAQIQAINSILGAASQGFDGISGIIEASGGKASGAFKAMFALSKGFAVAQAALNLQMAISQVMADPTALTPAQKFANYAAIASAGGAVLSSIGSISYGGGRKNGGPVSAGSMYRVGEGGAPEIYQAGTGKQYMIPGDNGKVISNKDMQGGSGGGGTVVQQEVNFHITTTNGIDDATMQRMAAMMKTVSLNTIKDQQRPNGLLRK
jgi:tape measure domain-containing protein